MSMPESPMTPLDTNAAEVHELYTAFVRAGFKRRLAFRLTVAIVTTQLRDHQ